MASIDKLIQKIKNQPANVRYDEVERVYNHIGYYQVRKKGSHRQFRNKQGDVTTVQHNNPVGKAYIKELLTKLEQ